jgi:two-component system LytT family sensor kinase
MKKPVIVLLHIVYWLLYLLLLALFFAFMTMGNGQAMTAFVYYGFVMLQFALLPALISFYVFYSLLFQRFLASRRIVPLALSAILVAVLATGFAELVMYISVDRRVNWTVETMITMGIIMSFNALLNGLLGLGMKAFITWYNELKWKEALNQKKHEMELALVKSQINPHFLFNTINNIDILIEKDPVLASSYLNRLSDIMRFMLYETKAEWIPLEKELEYIDKYIALQRIRTANPDFVHYAVSGQPAGCVIAPMLFIPFIENAFKHAASKRTENVINIRIQIVPGRLIFECSNSYSPGTGMKDEHSGLGNELIAKRLTLLYPGKHELVIADHREVYSVTLTIELK